MASRFSSFHLPNVFETSKFRHRICASILVPREYSEIGVLVTTGDVASFAASEAFAVGVSVGASRVDIRGSDAGPLRPVGIDGIYFWMVGPNQEIHYQQRGMYRRLWQ